MTNRITQHEEDLQSLNCSPFYVLQFWVKATKDQTISCQTAEQLGDLGWLIRLRERSLEGKNAMTSAGATRLLLLGFLHVFETRGLVSPRRKCFLFCYLLFLKEMIWLRTWRDAFFRILWWLTGVSWKLRQLLRLLVAFLSLKFVRWEKHRHRETCREVSGLLFTGVNRAGSTLLRNQPMSTMQVRSIAVAETCLLEASFGWQFLQVVLIHMNCWDFSTPSKLHIQWNHDDPDFPSDSTTRKYYGGQSSIRKPFLGGY